MPFDSRPLAYQVVIPSDLHAARSVEEQILHAAEHCGFTREAAFAVRLALEEAIVNAHKHGNRGDGRKTITISYEITPNRAIIRVRDQGPGFDPQQVPDPTQPERIAIPSGRGIMLMKAYLDEIAYNAQGNEVQLVLENRG